MTRIPPRPIKKSHTKMSEDSEETEKPGDSSRKKEIIQYLDIIRSGRQQSNAEDDQGAGNSQRNGGFRGIYQCDGVHEYYSSCLQEQKIYSNPHRAKFVPIFEKIFKYMKISTLPILDLGCGTGESTLIIKNLQIPNELMGSDPYLFKAYSENTQCLSFSYSFDDIVEGTDVELRSRLFSMIICSYALHLCENVADLCLKLSYRAEYLCILTPHGLPIITEEMGWKAYWNFKYKNVKINIYITTNATH
jgi:hypothetical protein